MQTRPPPVPPDPPAISRHDGKGLRGLSAAVGALVVAGTLAGWLLTRSAGDAPAVENVGPADVAAAAQTLTPEEAQAVRQDPQGCRRPMGVITLSTPGNAAGGSVRITTSKYVSPTFQITAEPQRIAIPIPVPPESGGLDVMTVEGNAQGLVVSLTPPVIMNLAGGRPINVWWVPRPACKS